MAYLKAEILLRLVSEHNFDETLADAVRVFKREKEMLNHLIHWLQHTFQVYPELAVYLTLSAGFFIGNLKLGKFSLGTVTAVLLVGVLVGQMHIAISPNV